MKFTLEAIELLKKFRAKVDCPEWDEKSIEGTMFGIACKKIAERENKPEIDKEVVRDYILKGHNPKVVEIGRLRKTDIDKIKNCMVVPAPDGIGNKWFCIHRTVNVCEITKKEAELLKKKNKKLLESL